MSQSSYLMAYQRGLRMGREKGGPRRGWGGYRVPKTQLGYMAGYMKGALERKFSESRIRAKEAGQ